MKSVIGDLLYTFRTQQRLSQKGVADLLGITQVTVSRIETGSYIPSAELEKKVRDLAGKISAEKLISKPLVSGKRARQVLETIEKKSAKGLNLSYFSATKGIRSGDLFSYEQISPSKAIFLVADAVGHGDEASAMAQSLEFGFKLAASVYASHMVSPYLIESSLRSAIIKTKTSWLGPPSMIIGMIEESDIFLINNGLPNPCYFSEGKLKTLKHSSARGALPLEKKSDGDSLAMDLLHVRMKAGDSLIMFSDGYKDAKGDVRDAFSEAAKSLPGDSAAILSHLTNDIGDEIEDDVTVALISRKRERDAKTTNRL